jgi:dipeptidyl aminopeptidase/acylaminoacyl peptidase
MTPSSISVLVLLLALVFATPPCCGKDTKKPYTVADEIELSRFIPDMDGSNIRFSPDGNYFAVYSARGRLDLNRPQDSLRFYRSQDVRLFLERSPQSRPPLPIWTISRSTYKEGPIIHHWRWLPDSDGVVFLERTVSGNQRLVLADLQKKGIEPLTPATETVQTFDIRDRNNYVYTVASETERKEAQTQTERQAAVVGTDRELYQLLLPSDPTVIEMFSHRSYDVWAVLAGKRFEVKHDGAPIAPEGDLALSPDGRSLVTRLVVPEVPKSWETLYPPPFAESAYRIRAGHGSASEYVRIDLQTGSIRSLTDAPTSDSARWWALGAPSWSSDGRAVLLSGTFIKSKTDAPSRPCVAIVELPSSTATCVEMLRKETETVVEDGYHLVRSVHFAAGDRQRVIVNFKDHQYHSLRAVEYQHLADGTWQARQIGDAPEIGHRGIEVMIKQGLNEPPLLVASNREISRVIWDPNPQLKNIQLGDASVYTWKDKEGRQWKGGLYKPSNYELAHRYPLVIQTHGFDESYFLPAGTGFPTAFAARALAAAGIVVLQVGETCPDGTPSEGTCVVSGYESGADQLVSDGLVDREKIGIIGFSRSCFYTMEALTTGSLHPKAASITDGWMASYFQYMQWPEHFSKEGNGMIGASPFGEGLQQWLKRSPEFNLDKVTTPLLVVGEGPLSTLLMWQTYAGLHYLNKPVDLIMLNTDEHVLTNPALRIASQGGSVDWFRFWLQGYEDPDSAKSAQYVRWRELRKLQDENERSLAVVHAASN